MSNHADWLALTNIPNLGPITLQKLLQRFGSASSILNASKEALASAGISKQLITNISAPDQAAIEQDLIWLEHELHHLITIEDAHYPNLLKQIADPPIVLYVHGKQDLSLLSEPQLAIVGSRNASANGEKIAATFSQKLAQSGLVITSGLASGIDGAAHQGAIQAEIGSTIAVAACGLDHVYPAQHRKLAEEIAQRGLIVSEFPIGMMPKAGHFPRRNRIISGLSLGVLIVEASIKSGSLITARLAAEQNREVFAIPGSIHSPLSKGPHNLIRHGAKLVEAEEDILIELQHHIRMDEGSAETATTCPNETLRERERDPEHEKILTCMGYEPISIDTIMESSGLNVEVISSMLLILELDGEVVHNGNGIYMRTTGKI